MVKFSKDVIIHTLYKVNYPFQKYHYYGDGCRFFIIRDSLEIMW